MHFIRFIFRDLDAPQSRAPQVRANSAVVSNKCEINGCACEVSRRSGDGALLIFMSRVALLSKVNSSGEGGWCVAV